MPLMQPKMMPRTRRSRGVARGYMRFNIQFAKSRKTTAIRVPIIQMMKWCRARSSSSWFNVWLGSGIAPNIPMSTAPVATNAVPTAEYRVKGSLRMMEAHIVLKTSPDYSTSAKKQLGALGAHTACKVDRTGSGSVVIWMVLPTRFATTNMAMPSC
jgi:hypothetical protein